MLARPLRRLRSTLLRPRADTRPAASPPDETPEATVPLAARPFGGVPLWLELAALALIVVVAAGLRLWRLDALPPGLHQDEAIYGILGYNVSQGDRGIFFGEREPLYMYLLALGITALGYSVLTLRLVAVAVNLATVVAVWGLGRLAYGRAAGLLAALGFATSLWQVTLGRDAFRAITLPLVEAVAALLLWWAIQRGGLWRWAIAGLAGGACLYTYTAARVLPLAFAVPVVLSAARSGWLRRHGLGLAGAAAAAAIIFEPLGAFFLDNTGAFTGRTAQVAGFGADAASPLDQLGRVAGIFLVAGDSNPRHNLPGAPMFDPIAGGLFLLGLGLALRRWRQPGYLWLPLWLGIGLLPTLLAIEAPHYLRALVAVEPAYLLFGVGAAAALGGLGRLVARYDRRRQVVAATLAAALLGAGLTAHTAWRYTQVWAAREDVWDAFNTDLDRLGRHLADSTLWLDGRDRADRVAISADYWTDRASAAFHLWPWLPIEEQRLDTTRLAASWFDEERALLLPAGDYPKEWLLHGPASPALALLTELGASTTTEAGYAPSHPALIDARLDRVPEWSTLAGFRPANTAFGSRATLIGWRIDRTEPRQLTLWWRIDADLAGSTPFVHLVDQAGRRLVALEGYTREPVTPRPGETLVTFHPLTLPLGAAPGAYAVLAGSYDPVTGARLPVAGAEPARDTLTLTEFVAPSPGDGPALGALPPRPIGPLSLLGLELPAGPVAPGTAALVNLTTRLDGATTGPLRLHLTLETPGANPAEWTREIGADIGTATLDQIALAVPRRAAAGAAPLRLRVEDAAGRVLGEAELGRLTVPAVPRRTEPPAFAQAADAAFGDFATLGGFTLEEARPGSQIDLALAWHAERETDTAYKVFVHLANADGSVVAQSDSMPDGGAQPTSQWLAGEWIADRHRFPLPPDLPPGEYHLLTGLYDERTGARVPVRMASGEVGDHVELSTVALGSD